MSRICAKIVLIKILDADKNLNWEFKIKTSFQILVFFFFFHEGVSNANLIIETFSHPSTVRFAKKKVFGSLKRRSEQREEQTNSRDRSPD